MANSIALIFVTGLAVLGAYYIVEVIAATALPKGVKASVVLPYLEDKNQMASVILTAINGYPGCEIIVHSEERSARENVPFRNGARVKVLTRDEIAAYFAQKFAE